MLSTSFATSHEIATISIYYDAIHKMKAEHVIAMAVLTFLWIWMLPLMILGFFLSVPVIVVCLPICLSISITLQFYHHGKIITNHPLRRIVSHIPWHEWFPCNTINIEETCVVAVHPHGVLCCGALAGIHFVPGSSTVFCVAPLLFYIPILGWCIRILGCVPAQRNIMLKCLQKGHSLVVVPGGVPELVLSEQCNDKKWFERSGFIHIAREAKVPIKAVFVQGECNTFAMVQGPFLRARVHWSWKTNIPLVLPCFVGWYGTWLPKRAPLILRTKMIDAQNKNEYYRTLKRFILENEHLN